MFLGTFSTFPTVQYGRHAHKDQNFYCFPFRENQSAYYKRIKKIRLFRFDVNNNKNIIIPSFGYKSQKKRNSISEKHITTVLHARHVYINY